MFKTYRTGKILIYLNSKYPFIAVTNPEHSWLIALQNITPRFIKAFQLVLQHKTFCGIKPKNINSIIRTGEKIIRFIFDRNHFPNSRDVGDFLHASISDQK